MSASQKIYGNFFHFWYCRTDFRFGRTTPVLSNRARYSRTEPKLQDQRKNVSYKLQTTYLSSNQYPQVKGLIEIFFNFCTVKQIFSSPEPNLVQSNRAKVTRWTKKCLLQVANNVFKLKSMSASPRNNEKFLYFWFRQTDLRFGRGKSGTVLPSQS